MDDRIAYVFYRLPGKAGVESYKTAYQALPFENLLLRDVDFIMSPYDKEKNKLLSFKFLHPVKMDELEVELLGFTGDETSKSDYWNQAEKVLHHIRSGSIDKLVLSKRKFIPGGLDPLHVFKALEEKYLNAFVYMVYIPGKLCWLGATPEVLLTESNGVYETVALAGTQIAQMPIDHVRWGEKEIEEHAYIERFVENALQQMNLNYRKQANHTVKAGQMYHIKSTYSFSSTSIREKILDMLHPGPAISGFPREEAMHHILNTEAYDRLFYTGFIGPVKQESMDIYVNLRCMEMFANGQLLYLGGGYTVDSSIEMEWEETELKASTMLNVLKENKMISAHDIR